MKHDFKCSKDCCLSLVQLNIVWVQVGFVSAATILANEKTCFLLNPDIPRKHFASLTKVGAFIMATAFIFLGSGFLHATGMQWSRKVTSFSQKLHLLRMNYTPLIIAEKYEKFF